MKLIAILGIASLVSCGSGDAKVTYTVRTRPGPQDTEVAEAAELAPVPDELQAAGEEPAPEESQATDEAAVPSAPEPAEEPSAPEVPALVEEPAASTELVAPAEEHVHDGTESCCAAVEGVAPSSYLEVGGPVADGAVAGTLRGKITFEGKLPNLEPDTITAKASEKCTDDGASVDPTNRSLLLHKDGGIANVVVTVDVKGAEVKVPEEPIEVDQVACRYEPHVILIPKGATIKYLNSDKVSHNVHTEARRNTGMNRMVGPGSSETQVLGAPEQIQIKCDVHPWMSAWMFVTEDPYTTITAADGTFAIAGLPPGEYKAELWHEYLDSVKKIQIVVNADGSCEPLHHKMSKGSGSRRRGR